jgi:Domain of unknown function (DUF5753)/Helix-turn-helix domain
MIGGGSVVVRRQLGAKLRRLRLAAGKDVGDVTEAGLGSKAKISRIETGKGPVRVADIRALCWLYGVDGPTTDALAALAPGTQQEAWWEELGTAVVPEWFSLYAGLEATASRLRFFGPLLVPGLMQTEDYARAVIGADPRLDPEVVEQRVRLRMQRQQAAADVTVIVGEAALSLVAGSAEIMSAQLARLRKVKKVRVLPFSAGPHPADSPFVLLDFADAEDPPVAYVEGAGWARYLDHPDDHAEYAYLWSVLHDRSIPIKEWKP